MFVETTLTSRGETGVTGHVSGVRLARLGKFCVTFLVLCYKQNTSIISEPEPVTSNILRLRHH